LWRKWFKSLQDPPYIAAWQARFSSISVLWPSMVSSADLNELSFSEHGVFIGVEEDEHPNKEDPGHHREALLLASSLPRIIHKRLQERL
jgi:hypothetical protein